MDDIKFSFKTKKQNETKQNKNKTKKRNLKESAENN